MNFAELLNQLTIDSVVRIAQNQNIKYDTSEIAAKMSATAKERYLKILETIQKESKEADFFGQLGKGYHVPAMVMQVAKVTMQHECLKYAKFLLGLPETEIKETV